MPPGIEVHARSLDAIRRAAPLFERVSKETKLLDAIRWPREVEERFFAAGGRELPIVEYDIDRARATTNVLDLDTFAMTLDVADPVQHWLARVASSYADGNRLLLAVGTRRFYELSLEIYGGPRSWFDSDTSNLDLARHLDKRLEGELHHAPHAEGAAAGAAEGGRARSGNGTVGDRGFLEEMTRRAKGIGLPIEVEIDDHLTAKVVAGSQRVRVRSGAQFTPIEVHGLFVHEVETHALTAQNGAAQPELRFLRAGGPRTTRTQEGLAVFAELHAHALPVSRMRRITQRVRLVADAEEGADFRDLYRKQLETGANEHDAFLDAERICRGGLVEGGAPFTKDAAYLAGMTEVFNFLQVAVRGGAREVVETLACGRIAIDDLAVLVELRHRGVLRPAKYTPHWLRSWEALLPYFAFTSFLNEIDLREVAARHRAILSAADAPVG